MGAARDRGSAAWLRGAQLSRGEGESRQIAAGAAHTGFREDGVPFRLSDPPPDPEGAVSPRPGTELPAGSAALARSVPAEPRSAAQPAPAPTAASQISCGEAISDPTPSPGRENIARSPSSSLLSAPSFAGMVGLS